MVMSRLNPLFKSRQINNKNVREVVRDAAKFDDVLYRHGDFDRLLEHATKTRIRRFVRTDEVVIPATTGKQGFLHMQESILELVKVPQSESKVMLPTGRNEPRPETQVEYFDILKPISWYDIAPVVCDDVEALCFTEDQLITIVEKCPRLLSQGRFNYFFFSTERRGPGIAAIAAVRRGLHEISLFPMYDRLDPRLGIGHPNGNRLIVPRAAVRPELLLM